MYTPLFCFPPPTGSSWFVNWFVMVRNSDFTRQTRLPGATDNTRYGEGRAFPHSFLTHHVANISTAIHAADALTILDAASSRMLRVSHGVCVCVF